MKVTSSVEFVWQLAGQEAIESHYTNIIPEHFFTAILKFAELDIEKVRDFVSKPAAIKELTNDLNAVKDVIQEKPIQCHDVCRKLLLEIGKGNAVFAGGTMHRSPDSIAFFDAALQIAQDTHCDKIAPVHLLNAMLSSPTKTMIKVLAAFNDAPKPAKQDKMQKKERVGKVLKNPPETTLYKIETKALIQALAHPSYKSVIIITRDLSIVEPIVTLTSKKLAKSDCPDLLKRTRIVDVSHLKTNAELNKALIDTSVEKGLILYIPPINSIEHSGKQGHWLQRLEQLINEKTIQCICRTTPTVYNDLIRLSWIWKKRVHPIWICDKNDQKIPREL